MRSSVTECDWWWQFNDEFTGFLDVGENEYYTLAGILAANHASISEGTVSGGNVLCGQAVPLTTFTAYVVPPINGTFTGTLNSSEGYQDQVSVQISENTSQQVTLTGTVTGNGVSRTVAVPSSNPAQMVGALINGGGTATDAQGTDSFHIAARHGAAASHIYNNISISNGENLTGYLSSSEFGLCLRSIKICDSQPKGSDWMEIKATRAGYWLKRC